VGQSAQGLQVGVKAQGRDRDGQGAQVVELIGEQPQRAYLSRPGRCRTGLHGRASNGNMYA
jgi:hypothetical protein